MGHMTAHEFSVELVGIIENAYNEIVNKPDKTEEDLIRLYAVKPIYKAMCKLNSKYAKSVVDSIPDK